MKTCPKCGAEYPDTTTLCPSDGIALEKTGDSLLGQTLAGKYRIEERLKEGGMGAVYRGTHVLMDKTVAVKVLRPSLAADEKIVARFSREARAASRISHPHALSVTDFGESEDGVVFLVMEYLDGKTLKEVIQQEGPMSLPRVVEIIRQVGGALDAAHEQGVVHRDLKSENIMLLGSGGPDYAKVLDFGIAKITEPEGTYDPGLTAPDLVIGTPQYMSPEQCSQSPDIDSRSDIYSLGVIVYEMLVGHVPFTGESSTSIMLKHLQEPAPSLLAERPDVPGALAHVVMRAMAKLPEDRYQSVEDLVEDLTMAAGMEANAMSSVAGAAGNRIIVPTQAGPRRGPAEDLDEETMVLPRPIAPVSSSAARSGGFNPWKILIPSMAGILVIFAVIYAFTRDSQPTNTNQTEPALVADPNSQPVEPASSPTGKSEEGIPTGSSGTSQVVNANVKANENSEAEASPVENINAPANANAEANQNSSPNVNANRPAANVPVPTPAKQLNSNEQPVPPPGEKTQEPKPTLPPANTPAPAA